MCSEQSPWCFQILFIGMQVFSAMSFRAKTSNFREFEESLQLGDVDRVNILNEKKIQVFIKEQSSFFLLHVDDY